MDNQQITVLVRALADGDRNALDQLVPLLYMELRRIASGALRNERAGHTLQPTALVHELYARMLGQDHPNYKDRTHFLAVSAKVMRQILIDHARAKRAVKRGGDVAKFSLMEAVDMPVEPPFDILAVDEALRVLEREDPRKATLIEMRYFGGLTAEESAEVLNQPVHKVQRELRVAQAWLRHELDHASTAAVHEKAGSER